MASSNILQLPFRRSHQISFKDAITKYISTKYDQHPQMFAGDLETIDRLRHEGITALEPHITGIRKLQAYAAQLAWLTSKFPVDIGIEFLWYPALGYNTHRPASRDNIRFELANVLFNLATMFSQLALAANRSTGDGLKAACNYFSQSAGVISHLKSVIVPDMRTDPPEDMDTATLEAVEHLMLAQAQECFWQKAVKDGLKDASIAKLAAKVSDFYSQASDWGVKSDAISSEWIHHMNAKHHHFAAAAQYRAACDCLEKRRYGEEVARLRDSLGCANEALKESRYINKAVLADLNGLKTRVHEDLSRAEKDNDMIYLIPVPAKSELKQLDRATMVAAKVPSELTNPINHLNGTGDLGRPLFAKLVPYSVHVAASIYTDRRDTLISEKIVQKLDALTSQAHDLMSSLGLPGSLQALEKPLGLPPGLSSHAQEIRQHNGIQRLYQVIADTEKLKSNDQSIFNEGVDMLRSEAAEDEAARRKYGTDRWGRRPTSEAAPQLYAKVSEVEGYLKQAASSDRKITERLRQNESMIRLLGGTDRDLEDFVPSSRRAPLTSKVEREVNNVRSILNDMSRIEARRNKKAEAVRAKAKRDDIHHDLIAEAGRLERQNPMQTIQAEQFEDFFEQRLNMYKPDRADIQVEESQQQEVLGRLKTGNEALRAARGSDTSTRDREQALQKLDNAYLAYKDMISNLETGRSFYNDLATVVSRFRDECRSHVLSRRQEASRIEHDLSNPLAQVNPQIVDTTSYLRPRVESTQEIGQQTPGQPQDAGRQAPIPVVAPMPTRTGANQPSAGVTSGMWTPDMPIRFGRPG